MSGQTYITFTEEDLALFSEASGDRNPLHLSHEYARSTPYGRPVVFGCLGATACLGHMGLPAGWSATSLEAEFLRPMFVGVRYRFETSQKEGNWEARLFDGSTHVLLVKVAAAVSGGNEPPQEVAAAPTFERRDAAVRQQQDIIRGLNISGAYAC